MNLRQLSEILGLSQTTISRALNGYPEVSAATRKRVMEAARRHNYRPNSRAKGLATGRAMAIASIVPTSSTHEIMNPVFSDFVAAASDVLRQAGYDLQLSVIPGDEEAQIYRGMAMRGSVDGLMIHAPRNADPRLSLLRDTGMPFVVHGRFSREDDSYSWVDMDNARAFAAATRQLLDLGHRTIALVNGLADMDFARRRLDGYRAALAERGIAHDPDMVRGGEMTEGHGYRSALALLDRPTPPTAFLASSMIVALGVERACAQRGLVLGRDVALISHDDCLSYLHNDEAPRFSAIKSPIREHGRAVATMLLDLIDNREIGPRQKLIASEMAEGPTLCPPPAR
jgi:LacI family transcriptional regulator